MYLICRSRWKNWAWVSGKLVFLNIVFWPAFFTIYIWSLPDTNGGYARRRRREMKYSDSLAKARSREYVLFILDTSSIYTQYYPDTSSGRARARLRPGYYPTFGRYHVSSDSNELYFTADISNSSFSFYIPSSVPPPSKRDAALWLSILKEYAPVIKPLLPGKTGKFLDSAITQKRVKDQTTYEESFTLILHSDRIVHISYDSLYSEYHIFFQLPRSTYFKPAHEH